MYLTYTGIGSRQTPDRICDIMTEYARRLTLYGYILRSGGAEGADKAFEIGARRKEIYLPWKGFNNNDSELFGVDQDAIDMAMNFHRTPHKLTESVKKLHGRNVYQILGKDMKSPSEFVIFWAPENNKVEGGTATAVNIARTKGMATFNLFKNRDSESLKGFMGVKHTQFIFRYCRHIHLFYSEIVDEDDATAFENIFLKDMDDDEDTEIIKKLFKKYWGSHNNMGDVRDIENFRK